MGLHVDFGVVSFGPVVDVEGVFVGHFGFDRAAGEPDAGEDDEEAGKRGVAHGTSLRQPVIGAWW